MIYFLMTFFILLIFINHLDKYNLNAAEEMLTPNELRDWIDTAERETSERIRVINDIYMKCNWTWLLWRTH